MLPTCAASCTCGSLPLQSLDRIRGIGPKHQLSHSRDLKLEQVLQQTTNYVSNTIFCALLVESTCTTKITHTLAWDT